MLRSTLSSLVSVALAWSLATPANATAPDDEIAMHYQRAEDAYAAGRYLDASEAWLAVLDLLDAQPGVDTQTRATVVLGAATALCEAVSHGEADPSRLDDVDTLLASIMPTDGPPNPPLAAALRDVERLRKVHGSANDPGELFATGQAAYDAGRFDEAVDAWREALVRLDEQDNVDLVTREAIVLSLVSALTEVALRQDQDGRVILDDARRTLDDHVTRAGEASPAITKASTDIDNLARQMEPNPADEPRAGRTDAIDRGPIVRGRTEIVSGIALLTAGLGAGVVTGLGAHELWRVRSDEDPERKPSHRKQGTIMVGAGAAGLAACVAAGTLLLIRGKRLRTDSTLSWVPVVTPQSGGLIVEGRF